MNCGESLGRYRRARQITENVSSPISAESLMNCGNHLPPCGHVLKEKADAPMAGSGKRAAATSFRPGPISTRLDHIHTGHQDLWQVKLESVAYLRQKSAADLLWNMYVAEPIDLNSVTAHATIKYVASIARSKRNHESASAFQCYLQCLAG